jgi:CubicO group peptidase (beta-lactamase class C family)
MRRKVLSLLALLAIVTGTAVCSRAVAFGASPSLQEPPLRLSEPLDVVVADLESFVPLYMQQENLPGVAIALIRDGEVVWTEAFGIANTITHKPVTPETLFQMASNSKVVTAYIALRLVDEGLLSLDEPLNAYLSEPWLPPSEYRDAITLRHVLSHTTGLGHLTLSRESLFSPGRGYSYSGIGFLYLQAVIEEVTGQPLEGLAQEMVFAPLGMHDSSFVSHSEIAPHTANGHLRALAPSLLFVIPFAVILGILGLTGLVVVRIRTGQWRPPKWLVIGLLAASFVLSLLPALVLLGGLGFAELAYLVVLCGLVLVGAFAVAFLAGQAIILRLLPARRGAQIALTVGWSVLVVVGLALLASNITNLPVPKWPPPYPSSGGTLRATASDVATFLIELSDPQHLSAETAAQLQTPQVTLGENLSWGLGPGIQHSQQGDALWQWGQHLHFQSVMVIYPESGFGAVVCTNNDLLSPDVAVEIAHRALGGRIEPIRRAIRLEYNYREEE